MGIIKGLSRLGVLLGSLGVIAVAFAGIAPASMAMVPVPGAGGIIGTNAPAPVVHTVVVGGMPGWQIASISVVVAMVAAITAVLADRAREARRRLLSTPA